MRDDLKVEGNSDNSKPISDIVMLTPKSRSKVTTDGATANKYDVETPFAIVLHAIVTDEHTDHCIHWLPCGKRFQISDKKCFAENILPHYFESRCCTKFTSFTRRLQRWQFKRIPSGPQMGAYHHDNFLRDQPELAEKMAYSTKTKSKKMAVAATLHRESTDSCASPKIDLLLSNILPTPLENTQEEELDESEMLNDNEMMMLLSNSNLFRLHGETDLNHMPPRPSPSPANSSDVKPTLMTASMSQLPLQPVSAAFQQYWNFMSHQAHFQGRAMPYHSTFSHAGPMSMTMMPNLIGGAAALPFPTAPTISATLQAIGKNELGHGHHPVNGCFFKKGSNNQDESQTRTNIYSNMQKIDAPKLTSIDRPQDCLSEETLIDVSLDFDNVAALVHFPGL